MMSDIHENPSCEALAAPSLQAPELVALEAPPAASAASAPAGARISCSPLILLVLRLGLLLAAYSVFRGLFLLFNWAQLADSGFRELSRAFVHGVRFDLSTLLLLNAPFVLLDLAMPAPKLRARPWFRRGYNATFMLVNLVPFVIEAIDAECFEFFGRRSSFAALTMMGDIKDQAIQLVVHFWYVAAIVVPILVFLGLGILRASRKLGPSRWGAACIGLPAYGMLGVGTLALMVLGIRGGLQAKPLSPAHAFANQTTMLGALTLNTTFNAIHNPPNKDGRPLNFLPPDRDLRGILGEDSAMGKRFPPARDNVVVIILEGFGLEHVGERPADPSYTPFFASLASRGLFFTANFANGRRSMEALSSIFGGFPSLMEEPYIASPYSGNEMHGLAEALRAQGYATHFFHGAKNGSMFIDSMARLVGFDRYHGMAEYPHQERDFDGDWGIADEPFLQYAVDQLSTVPQPFLAGIFTLSAHNPYTIPEAYRGRFPKGTNPIHESLGYSDYALRRFFESAAGQPWYRHTLFVLTADHTASTRSHRFRTETGLYRVPLLFFHPGGKLPASRSERITQHADIMPSVLDFLGIDASRLPFRPLPFGRSVFDARFPGRAVNQVSGKVWMATGDRIVRLEGTGSRVAVEALDPDGLRPSPCATPPERSARLQDELLAYLQMYKNGLIRNDWYRREQARLPSAAGAVQAPPPSRH